MSRPNVASATGTRLDSAAKHQVTVRTNYDQLLSWVGYEQNLLLKDDGFSFSIAKDDVCVGISRPVRKNEHGRGSNKAYMSVVSTLARIEPPARNYLIMLYHNPFNFQERDAFIQHVERRPDAWDPTMSQVAKRQIAELPEFYFGGICVTAAKAHPSNGDTAGTAMIGGMITIINGAFEVETGAVLQWYWDAETFCFDKDGRRHETIDDKRSEGVDNFLKQHKQEFDRDSAKRKASYDKSNRVSRNDGKQGVALPKAYKPDKNGRERIGDRLRIFGMAIGGARPFEKLDVLIGRQSM